ncbi:MAG: hypothetical protein ACE5HY_06475 [Candidatus Hydrothermarchaeales archaeon]
MIKVKTFTQTIEVFKTAKELTALDDMVNDFIAENNIEKIVSISDTTTTNDNGATIGIIRVLAYGA